MVPRSLGEEASPSAPHWLPPGNLLQKAFPAALTLADAGPHLLSARVDSGASGRVLRAHSSQTPRTLGLDGPPVFLFLGDPS